MTDAPIGFVHSDASDKWASSPERALIFHVERPNPEYDPHIEVDEGQSYDVPQTLKIEYTMPAAPHPGLGLHYLRYARESGLDMAQSWLIEAALGKEAYFALADELAGDPAPEATFGLIVNKILARAMGRVADPKAPTSSD